MRVHMHERVVSGFFKRKAPFSTKKLIPDPSLFLLK
jgi:hypothetical protein